MAERGVNLRPADVAWFTLLGGILTYEACAGDGELLSEGWDRYLERWPISARVFPLVLTLHVINAIPPRFDPIHQLAVRLRGVNGRCKD